MLTPVPDDPRVGPSATFGKDWLPGVHEWQLQQLPKKESTTERLNRDPLATQGDPAKFLTQDNSIRLTARTVHGYSADSYYEDVGKYLK